jgi:hypothetical protein
VCDGQRTKFGFCLVFPLVVVVVVVVVVCMCVCVCVCVCVCGGGGGRRGAGRGVQPEAAPSRNRGRHPVARDKPVHASEHMPSYSYQQEAAKAQYLPFRLLGGRLCGLASCRIVRSEHSRYPTSPQVPDWPTAPTPCGGLGRWSS